MIIKFQKKYSYFNNCQATYPFQWKPPSWTIFAQIRRYWRHIFCEVNSFSRCNFPPKNRLSFLQDDFSESRPFFCVTYQVDFLTSYYIIWDVLPEYLYMYNIYFSTSNSAILMRFLSCKCNLYILLFRKNTPLNVT